MRLKAVSLLIFLLFAPSLVQTATSLEPKHVLLLNSYNQRMSWVKDILSAVEKVLDPDNNNIVLHISNMDSKQFHSPQYFDSYKKHLKTKYMDQQFSLILSSDNNAFEFLRKNRDTLFSDVPVVFCGVNNFNDEQIETLGKFTGVAEIFSAKETIEMVLRLHPDTKEIFIVNDYLETGRAWQKDIDLALSDIKKKVKITYSKNLTITQLQESIGALDKNAIVLLGVYFADKNLKYFTYEKIGAMLSGASHVPVYCLLEFNMSKGVVGGEVISGYYQGEAMAKIGKQILANEDPDTIPVLKEGANRIMFDHMQLKRFGVTESSLPDGSVIINRPFSLFEKYKKQILFIIFMVTVLVVTIIALVMNILQRISAEEALKKSEKEYKGIFENAVEGFFQSTPEGRFISINPSFAKMLGYGSPEELMSSITDITSQYYVNSDDRLRYQQLLKESGKTENYEFKAQCKDGSQIWISNCTRAYYDQEGKIIRYEGTVQDITERKQAENALKESEERLKVIFEANPDPVVVYEQHGFPLYLNPAFTKVFGWHLNELKGRQIPFLPLEEKELSLSKIKEIYESGNPVQFETKRLSKHGKIIDVLLSAAIIKNLQGINNGLVVNLKDITDRKKLELQLLQTQKLESIGTLAGGIAHDFNNILSGIFGFSHLAKTNIDNPEKAGQDIDQIIIGAQRATELVQQILAFSRKSGSEKQALDVFIVVKETLKLLRSTIPSTITIKENIVSKARILADPTQIHQIIMNLCTNAYHAMGDTRGVLTVGLHEVEILEQDRVSDGNIVPGTHLKLEVSDTGSGIDEETLGKIFDPYFTTKEIGKGTGLGLAVVDGIVRSHNGFIKTQSESGKGSLFQVFFPIIQHDTSPNIQKKKKTISLLGSEQLMLVDDETAILKTLKAILEKKGYQVTAFVDGPAALKEFAEKPDFFDLAITDMTMPGMTGAELSAEMLKIRKNMPIILCTGYHESFTEDKAREIGICKYVQKPIESAALANLIREILD